MSLRCHAVGSRAARGRNWSPRSRNLCSEGRATGHVLFSRMTSRKGAPTLPRGCRTANFTSRLDLSIEHLVRAPLASHRLGFKLCAQAFLPSEQGRACAPRRKSGGKTQLGSRTRRVYRPAASEPQLPRQASTGGCPRLRGGAKSAMSGELSSDATLLAKGCECESFGSPDPGPGVLLLLLESTHTHSDRHQSTCPTRRRSSGYSHLTRTPLQLRP